ncbi:MAG: aminotransferase class V-fold PLP-dependent enzyme [Syntrophobacteraceae bacterium]|jgi:2-aminoethylphosphonate-pyruvate transaminase
MNKKHKFIEDFVAEQNQRKLLFTAGPASLLPENLTGLRPCFGRGDDDYAEVEKQVLSALKTMTGHQHIVRMQGSGSLAIEIAILNFIYGRVLVISTGYYSDRLKWLVDSASRRTGAVTEVKTIDWRDLEAVSGKFDWVLSCYTETSCGLKLPIESLAALARRAGAFMMVDATASIGLEERHDLADVIAFSSCKGLFGFTGCSFISFNRPATVEVDSFYLRLDTHSDKLMTGPYHSICSLVDVLPKHDDFRASVVENKRIFLRRMRSHLTLPDGNQPLLCTHVDCEIESRDPRVLLYRPRSNVGGSVVCHLGEVHLGRTARAAILDGLEIPGAVGYTRGGSDI